MARRRRRPRGVIRAAQLMGISDELAHTENLLEWAETVRYINDRPLRIPGPLREIYLSQARLLVLKKAAQVGATELAVNLLLHCADTGYAGRGNAGYFGPTDQVTSDIAQARVLRAVHDSPYLASRLGHDAGPSSSDLFRLNRGYVYMRSAGSESNLHSIDADLVVLDEFDRMHEDVRATAEHRLDSSRAGRLVVISTPTLPDHGIDRLYQEGDQREWLVTCLTCGREQPVTLDSIEISGHPDDPRFIAMLVCESCRDRLGPSLQQAWETGENGRWAARNPNGRYPSYHLSHLYQPHTDDWVADRYRDTRADDPQVVRQAYNQHLGEPWAFGTDNVSLAQLRRLAAKSTLTMQEHREGVNVHVMGVDVGRRFHCWTEGRLDGLPCLVSADVVDSFGELERLLATLRPGVVVIDGRPELHGAMEFAQRHADHVYLASYAPGVWPPRVDGRRTEAGEWLTDPRRRYQVRVDRTAAMDRVAQLLRGREGDAFGWSPRFVLPRDAAHVPNLFDHLSAPVRVTQRREGAGSITRWQEGARADDFFHAATYAMLAWYIDPKRDAFLFNESYPSRDSGGYAWRRGRGR